jgi:hypothetical protein
VSKVDPPAVAAEIDAMKRAWDRRLVLACLTMAAIVAFFAVDLWGDERMAGELMTIAPWFLGLALAIFATTRLAVARQAKQIRAKAAGGGRASPAK